MLSRLFHPGDGFPSMIKEDERHLHREMVKMGIPYLSNSRGYSQEPESRFNLAIAYLAILIVYLTLFSVPLDLKPQCLWKSKLSKEKN